jgi:hypothetical protein
MIIAAVKLHQRTLGPVLEASGWAINGRVKLNLLLGRILTRCATLPPGAARRLHDPYADRSARRRSAFAILLVVLAAALVAAWRWGFWPF